MDSNHSVAFQQCRDLVLLQQQLCSHLQQKVTVLQGSDCVSSDDYEALYRVLQNERAEHANARSTMSVEREKVQIAEREIEILSKQLEREKETFEKAFGLLKTQVLADSSKAEELLVKCTALEALCSRKDGELACKDEMIAKLQQKLNELELSHRREIQELKVQMQQEMYMAQRNEQQTKYGRKHK